MTKIEKIKSVMSEHRKKQDKLFSAYQKEEKRARERYSEKAFQEEFMMKTWVTYASDSTINNAHAVSDITFIFEDIENGFRDWVMKPLDAATVQTLNCINDFQISLSLPELQVIEKKVSGYFGLKIFAGIAKKNGYEVSVPGMAEYLKELESVKNNAIMAINAYAGAAPSYPGRDLLDHWTYQGVDYGPYQDYHLLIAANFLKDGGQLSQLESMWGQARAPMQYTLSGRERETVKKKVDAVFDSFGDLVPKEADQLLENDPDLLNKLQSMDNYENGENVRKYFEKKKVNGRTEAESRINPALDQAKAYVSGHGLADEKILAQYK